MQDVMQRLTFVEPGTLRWTEAPVPALDAPAAALVRPLAVTTCDLDHRIVTGAFPLPGPFPLGHEFVAEVTAVGADVRSVRPGDRVVVPFQISCGACATCRTGATSCCTAVPLRSAYGLGPIGGDWGGAFDDVVRVPFADAMLLPVPAGVAPAAIASASDNLCDAWRTVAPPLAERPGADVLVVAGGAHSIALYAVAIARACGAGRIAFVDSDADRLALAARLGAEPLPGPPPHRAGHFPVAVDASADPAGLACALRSLTPYGICTSVGIYFADTAVPMRQMYERGARFVTGRVNARAHLPAVLALVADGRLAPETVTTGLFGWEEAADVLPRGLTKPVFVRDATGQTASTAG